MNDDAATRRPLILRPLLLAILFAVLFTLLLAEVVPRYAPGLLRFEHMLGDVRTSFLSDRLPSQHPQIALVAITDDTLKDSKVRQPIDRTLLTRLVDAIDAAGPRVIGIDMLMGRLPPPDNEASFIEAIRRAKAKVVLAAGDARMRLPPAEAARQAKLIDDARRPAGFVNLAVERDWVVRFKAQPGVDPNYPRSFARLLAEQAGYQPDESRRRIAWLLEPHDGSDTFLTIPAHILLQPAGDAVAQRARAALKDKIVILGGAFPDYDRHITPLSTRVGEMQSGAAIHAHMTAEFVDGRGIVQLEANSWALRLELAAVAALAFLIGWRTRHQSQGLLIGSFATAGIIAVDTFVFWQWRIILPVVLALLAWFLGEFSGHFIGRWLGRSERSRWFVK